MGIHQALILTRAAAEMPPPPQQYIKLVSNPYTILVDGDQITVTAAVQQPRLLTFFGLEEIYPRASVLNPALQTTISYLSYVWPVTNEQVSVSAVSAFNFALTSTISYYNYTNWPADQVSTLAAVSSFTLTTVISYVTLDTWPPDQVSVTASIQGVSLV